MDDLHYILTVQNGKIFKETELSSNTPVVNIGTLQNCDIRLKSDMFDVPVFVTVFLDGESWHAKCNSELCFSTRHAKTCSETLMSSGDVLDIKNPATDEMLFQITFAHDFMFKSIDYNYVIDISGTPNVIIGAAGNANIRLSGKYIGSESIILQMDNKGRIVLNVDHAPDTATLNGVRVFKAEYVNETDFIGIADFSFYYRNGVLYTEQRAEMSVIGIESRPLRDETPAFTYPKLNRSPRMIYKFDDSPIEVLLPPGKPAKPKENIAMQLMPALAMIGVTVITRSGIIGGLGSGNPSFLIFSLSSMSVGLLTTIAGFVHSRKSYKKSVEEWKSDYFAYIERKRGEIETEQARDRGALLETYPGTEELRTFVKTFSGRLFERSIGDADFLNVRAGLGSIKAIREITCNNEDHVKVENELMYIPEQVCGTYRNLNDVPVLIHLRESGSVGVVGTKDDQYDFFKVMLLDLCIQHSYEDLHVIVLLPPNEVEKYKWIKWMPHIKNSGDGVRGIVCDDQSRDDIFEYLYTLMGCRQLEAEQAADYVPDSYYVVFALDDWGIKTHPLSQYAEGSSKLGLCFINFNEYKENLPKECVEIVELNGGTGTLRYKNDKEFKCQFARETVQDESIKFVADRLAPVYCEKIALASRLKSNITLFELLNIISPEDLNLNERWGRSAVQNSLAAPLGVDVKGNTVYLDLHEKAHGPHGLVAGTTGSGKSEIMQSYILSAAVNFHPYEVAFVIIDFKGGGMANQFETLPHLIGKITDIDSHEINRSLLSIRAELEKRKRLFAQYEVNHIDQYIAKFRSGAAKIALPHLILIVDEFAELKAEQPEFMKELISTARVGRSLGIHLILATQKPAGQVNDQIWSNSRFKLCLKVATKEDSTEVLKSPLAFEIREPGRAYFQVGNNEIFTLFQSAYSGASAISDKNGNINEFSISEVEFTGKMKVVYERKRRMQDGKKLTQLKAMVDYVRKYCDEHGIPDLPSICMPPLPEAADYREYESSGAYFSAVIGIYDDPANQVQPPVELDLLSGNVFVVGAAQMGKTVLLQTILRGIAQKYTPAQVSMYILDFGAKTLKIFEDLAHVGGIMTEYDDERLRSFFKMMTEEIAVRKEKFSSAGAGSFDTYIHTSGSEPMPLIVIMIDNLFAFKELYGKYEDPLLDICREGSTLGITVVATAKQCSGLSYKYLSNFPARFAFTCTENSEYNTVFDRCRIAPKNVPGRGLLAVDKVIYEFQAFLPFDGIVDDSDEEPVRSESRKIEQARQFIREMNLKYKGMKARAVPVIPAVLTGEYWRENRFEFGDYTVPVGLGFSDVEPVTVDLLHGGALGIMGREGFGKSNLVRTILKHVYERSLDVDFKAYLVDSYDRQLAEFKNHGFVERYTADYEELEDIIAEFRDESERRMDLIKAGESLDSEPLMLCVIQNMQIYANGIVSKKLAEDFQKLVESAKRLRMFFILSGIEYSDSAVAPDMLKAARTLPAYVLLDDLKNIKLGMVRFNQAMKEFTKPLTVGEGYLLVGTDDVSKIKLVLTEEE